MASGEFPGLLFRRIAPLLILACMVFPSDGRATEMLTVEVLPLAERIFKNECDVEKNCFIQWNSGENFLSLGLGHFIWYPDQVHEIFGQSFRAFLQYARNSGDTFPAWLDKDPFPNCPWATRQQFLASKGSPQYQELFEFLERTKLHQAEYLVENAQKSLRLVVDAVPENQRPRIRRDISRLTENPQGLYAIVDYVNFKGTGIRQTESYSGEGWGLLQVMLAMRDTENPQETLEEFVRAAKDTLQRRVANSPATRNEIKWLQGWLRRVETYLSSQSGTSSGLDSR